MAKTEFFERTELYTGESETRFETAEGTQLYAPEHPEAREQAELQKYFGLNESPALDGSGEQLSFGNSKTDTYSPRTALTHAITSAIRSLPEQIPVLRGRLRGATTKNTTQIKQADLAFARTLLLALVLIIAGVVGLIVLL
jgi:hypothetical protein